MPDLLLHVPDGLPRIGLVPAPVEVLGHGPKLDNQVAGEVLRFDFTTLLTPKAKEGRLSLSHNGAGVRPADEIAAVGGLEHSVHAPLRAAIRSAAHLMVSVTSNARSEKIPPELLNT